MYNVRSKKYNKVEDEKIPVERVLDDMYGDTGISGAARDYYYNNYATELEQEEMDQEDRRMEIYAKIMLFGPTLLMILAYIILMFK